jgi:amino acid transporter
MLMVVPVEQLGLVSGIIDTLQVVLGNTGIGASLVTILGVGALYTFLTNMVTWTMGTNRTAAKAADEGDLPAIFGRLHPVNKTPVGAYLVTGFVSTVVLLIYSLMAGSAEDLFWTLFAFSTIVFLIPYLALFPAFLKLRRADASRPRPYRVPGNHLFATILTIVCMIFILQAMVFFVWVPGEPIDWEFAFPILAGVVITLVIGEFLTRRKKNN